MLKTKIEWCDSTWNPVTGCRHNCHYCYAKRIAERFGGYELGADYDFKRIESESGAIFETSPVTHLYKRYAGNRLATAPYPFRFEPTFHKYRLDQPRKWIKPQNIFVCSMADLFGKWVPDEWIHKVFDTCRNAPQHRYLFLTKNPGRYTQYRVPDDSNKWYGASITQESEMRQFNVLPAGCNIFVSMEPVLEDLQPEKHNILFRQIGWIILGAESGKRKDKVVPQAEWIKKIVWHAKEREVPVFMKDSLIPIVGEENMRREFPWKRSAK